MTAVVPDPVAVGARTPVRTATPPRSERTVRNCALMAWIRSPVTNSVRSHQWDPMSANVRDGPPASSSTRQF